MVVSADMCQVCAKARLVKSDGCHAEYVCVMFVQKYRRLMMQQKLDYRD